MRARAVAFLSLGVTGGVLALWAGGCGQGFTAADGGAPDRKTPKDVLTEDTSEEPLREAAPSDSGGPPDASLEVGTCHGLKGTFMDDSRNCGGCGHDCGLAATCTGGFCALATLASGLMMPDSIAVDGSEDVFFSVLGLCSGSTCTGGQVLRHTSKTGVTTVVTGLTADTFGLPVATDGTYVYWATSQTPGTVSLSPVAGLPSPTVITPASKSVPITASWVALAVDDTYLYAAASGATIYYVPTKPQPMSLGAWKPIGDPGQVLSGAAAVDVLGVHYALWINGSDTSHAPGTGSIAGVTVNAMGTTTALPGLTGLTAPSGVAASAFGAFWVDGNSVHQLGLKSMSPDTLISPGAGLEPSRVVVSAKGAVYWTNHNSTSDADGNVMVLYHGAKTPIVLASGQANPTALAISTYRVYWVNSGLGTSDGAVMSTRR